MAGVFTLASVASGIAATACTPDVSLGYWVLGPSTGPADAASTSADGASPPPRNDAAGDAKAMTDGAEGTGSKRQCSQLEQEDSGVCDLGNGVALPQDLTVETVGIVRFFAGGAILPSGRYRVEYVDGCAKYDAPSAGWSVHGVTGDVVSGSGACWLVGDGGALIVAAPGTSGVSVGTGPFPFTAYETYDECVAANCALPASEFTFGGGVLGIRQGAGIPFAYISGETIGGRGPTFRLRRLDPCS